MPTDDSILQMMEEANALLKIQGHFHEQIVKGRMEVVFSKLQSNGSGADIRYVPKDIVASTVLNDKSELVSTRRSMEDCIAWFGDNPHPKVRTAQGHFERALAHCTELLAARRRYEEKWLR